MTKPALPPPLVSVIISCYNGEKTIQRAIESVKAQTVSNLECIVVDDGSTDSSRQAIGDTIRDDRRFRYIYKNNGGVATARNFGVLQESKGKFISCLDKDDAMAPMFLEVCIKALQDDNSLGIAYTGLWYIRANGTEGLSEWPGQWDYDRQLQGHNQIPTCNVARREVWERLGGQRQRFAPEGAGEEDSEMWLRAGAYGWKAKKVTDEGLFIYSWQSGQVSGNPQHHMTDYRVWHPWAQDGQHPFASYATPARHSHAVRAYDEPSVSVIIPVGPGHEREVINALDSLEAQTFRKWEAIVVWDGIGALERITETVSGNHVVKYQWDKEQKAIHKAYPYVKFRSIGTDKPRGAGWARNFGASFARAPFLDFLDADDWLYPECLEKKFKAWNEHRAIIYTDYVGKAIVGDPGQLATDLRERLYAYDERKQEAVIGYRAADYDCERAIRQPETPTPFIWCNVTALIPKAWHDAIGGFDESMESWEDVDYHWRHARAGHCYYHLQEELMVYRFYTGARRDRGLQKHENLVKYIRSKYEGIEPMACPGGCGKGQSVNYREVNAPSPNPFMAMPGPEMGIFKLTTGGTISVIDADMVKIKLVSNNRASRRYDGPPNHNGGSIDYGYHSPGDVFIVHRLDVGGIFQPVQEQAVKLPEIEAVETPAPAALPGVEIRDIFDAGMDIASAMNAAFVQTVDMGPISEAITTGFREQPIEELAPATFDPDTVLASIKSLRAFVSSGGASKPMLRVLLEMEQGGKARPSAIKELERALG